MKIYLFDSIIDGHHKKYNDAIFDISTIHKKIEMVDCYSEPIKYSNNRLCNEVLKFKQIFNVILKTKKNEVIHFLYLDNVILVLYVFYRLKILNNKRKVSATLHWATNNKYKKRMLRYMFKENLSLVCHSSYIIEKQKQIYGENKNLFKEIRYPYFPYKSNENEKNDLKETFQKKIMQKNKIKVLYFGGTRLDKGLDILLESLKKVNRQDISIFIIGSEETFDRYFIDSQIKDLNIDINVHLNYVNETTAAFIFKNVNYTVLPYRENFSGESGPLIDSLANNIKVLAPDTPIFVKNNEDVEDVIFYRSEDSEELAKIINNLKYYEKYNDKKYSKRLELNTFKKNYQEYFESFLGEKL